LKKYLTYKDFEKIFPDQFDKKLIKKFNSYDFEYEDFSESELKDLYLVIIRTLLSENIIQSGKHRHGEWEDGWGENLGLLKNEPYYYHNLIPRYFNKYNAIRFNGKFIKPISPFFEFNSLQVILDYLFNKYCLYADEIYEFGCGTSSNLIRVRNFNKHARIIGLDWSSSSQDIIDFLSVNKIETNISGYKFDYFDPTYEGPISKNAIFYTVASLEQVGSYWEPFINFCLSKKPKLCFHVEPIAEVLDENVFEDYLSIEYFKKRNYLSGFYDGLIKLEKEGKLDILSTIRTHIGSLFIEGYTIIVWAPKT